MVGEFVICRSREQGVVTGYLRVVTMSASGLASVELEEARQVHWWGDGANTLFEMSLRGCGNARISEPVDRVMVFGVCGILPCTESAKENLSESRWNKPFSGSRPSRRAKANA
jgi:hypothetical protein